MEVRPLPDMARASKPTEYLAASDVQERIRTSNTAKQLGFVIEKAERGKVTLRMPVEALHKQVHGWFTAGYSRRWLTRREDWRRTWRVRGGREWLPWR